MQNNTISLESYAQEHKAELFALADMLNEGRVRMSSGRYIITRDDDLYDERDDFEWLTPFLDEAEK